MFPAFLHSRRLFKKHACIIHKVKGENRRYTQLFPGQRRVCNNFYALTALDVLIDNDKHWSRNLSTIFSALIWQNAWLYLPCSPLKMLENRHEGTIPAGLQKSSCSIVRLVCWLPYSGSPGWIDLSIDPPKRTRALTWAHGAKCVT